MGKVQAFSSVSVVDLTDVGSLNFYLTSNLPNSVIYDPNTNNGTYSPNWAASTSHLIITPVISYNGSNLPLNTSATQLVVSYKRKEGTGSETNLQTGETVSGNVLTVSANKLSNASGGQLTYICTVSYTDPNTGVPIEAQSSLTYSLITMASELKYAGILAENTAFLYNTSGSIVGAQSIELTPDLTNCSLSQWQYKNTSGDFVAFPSSAVSQEGILTITHNMANIWDSSDKFANIKLTTDDPTIYDFVQIIKIRDGAAGSATVTCILTNENHTVPVNAQGQANLDNSSTEIHIYEGGNDVTSQWTITKTDGSGLTGTYNSSTHVYTPTELTVDTSYAEFVCTRTGYSQLTKRYTIQKQYAGLNGQDAVIYEVIPDVYSLNLNESGNFTPSTVVFHAYKKIGNNARTNYDGRYIISDSTDGTTFTVRKTSSVDADSTQSLNYLPGNNVVLIKCVLYATGGTTTQLDEQTVVITKDGISGQDGQPGTDGLSMGLGNYTDVIPCNNSGTAASQRTLSIPFYAYKGISKVGVVASVDTQALPNGVTLITNTQGTTSSDGLLQFKVASGATFGNASTMTGDITITLTAEGRSVDYKYTWTKNNQALNGTNAVILQLYSADGGNVKEGKNTTITAVVYSGITDVTSSSSFVWKEFKNGNYTEILGTNDSPVSTTSTITITPDMVTDQMWLKCEAKYPTTAANPYVQYFTIDDTTDELTAYTYATISEFKNSQGHGAIYTRVYRDGIEVDPIKTTTFSNVAPTGGTNGDYYYHLDTTAKTCVLKKHNGSQWIDATSADSDKYIYSYYRIDNKGDSIDTTAAWKTGRCQYVDPSIINGRMQFICEVSEA